MKGVNSLLDILSLLYLSKLCKSLGTAFLNDTKIKKILLVKKYKNQFLAIFSDNIRALSKKLQIAALFHVHISAN